LIATALPIFEEIPVSVAADTVTLREDASHRRTRTRRSRWYFWQSPDDQPAWARPTLLGIAAVALVLYAWHITDAGLAPFYSTAVKSMSESWKAFFYGAFDPAATITIDKLAGSFLPQALSARIFGFHPWSLALPQVIEGVVSVLVMYRVVRRWAGVTPGLLAAAIFTLTPVAASMFGHSMEDGALTMCLVLAADAYQLAVTQARLRPLIGAGGWVGLGFQAKMLQAWMVLPALAIGYLLFAPTRLRRRLWQLGAAGLVMLAVSLSWIALYTFTPAGDRPYVDGSTDNSAFAMVFGYNGLERFGINFPGAVTSGPGVTSSSASDLGRIAGVGRLAGSGGGGPTSGSTFTKLIGHSFGPEIAWLFPLALLTLVFGLWALRRARRTDQLRAGLVLWGIWLLTYGLIYSKMSVVPHTAYVAALAAPLAALGGTGIVMFSRWYRSGERRGWLLPVAVAVELAWALYLWSDYPDFLPSVKWLVMIAGLITLVALVLLRLSSGASKRLMIAGLAAGAVVMVAAPATWAASVLDPRYAGSSFDAAAGPAGAFTSGGNGSAGGQGGGAAGGRSIAGGLGQRGPAGDATGAPGAGSGGLPGGTSKGGSAGAPPGGGFPGGGRPGTGQSTRGQFPGAGGPAGRAGPSLPAGGGTAPGGVAGGGAGGTGGGPGGETSSTTLTGTERALYDYLRSHRDGAKYLMAVQSWTEASPYIVATGQEVLPIGGFSGSVPEPTLAHFRDLVRTGQLRFVLLDGASGNLAGGAGPGGGSGRSQADLIASWVERTCSKVPAKDYSGSSASAAGGSTGTLYVCRGT
jgi:4-amino-4-deoxy-L-arabinose transferase-like glycosyltransferase